MGGKGSGPSPQFHDPYHVIKRQQMREIRATQNELSATVKELALLQLHKVKDQKTLKSGRGVSKPLPKRYNDIVAELFRGYGDAYSKEQIENQVRQFVGHNLSQLKNQKKAYDDQAFEELCRVTEQIYIERNKADKLLTLEFGHTDPQKHIEILEPIWKDTNRMEDLWLNCMEFLRSKGFSFYTAKLAADAFVFPEGLTDPLDPYQYYDPKERFLLKRHYAPRFLYNPKIVAWKADEAEQTARLEETFITVHKHLRERERLDAQARKAFFEFWRPYLKQQIIDGYPDNRIKKEMRKRYRESTVKELMQLVTKLREKGYKPLDGKFKVELEVVDEEPENKVVHDFKLKALDHSWLECMEGYLGTPPSDPGLEWDKPAFEDGVLHCVASTEKEAGKLSLKWSLSQSLLNQGKKLWSHRPEPRPRPTEQIGGEKDVAYPNKAITARDLEWYCQNTYGKGWTHKRITDTADGIDQDACISPNGDLKVIIDYKDVLRGTMKPAEPETAKGTSPAEKKTIRIRV